MEALIRQYILAYNAMDVAGMLALLHDAIIFENISSTTGTTTLSGKGAVEKLARQSLGVFISREQRIRSLTLGDRTAAVEIEFNAILAVDLPGGSKAGEAMTLRGVTIFAFSDQKIARISDYS